MRIPLYDKVSADGVVFKWVEVRTPSSRLGVIYCEYRGIQEPLCFRVDFDKQVVFDDTAYPVLDEVVRQKVPLICGLVEEERARMTSSAYASAEQL